MDLCEFKASLVYRVSSRTGSKATQRNPVSKNQRVGRIYIFKKEWGLKRWFSG